MHSPSSPKLQAVASEQKTGPSPQLQPEQSKPYSVSNPSQVHPRFMTASSQLATP